MYSRIILVALMLLFFSYVCSKWAAISLSVMVK
jgi:hypothetical protein